MGLAILRQQIRREGHATGGTVRRPWLSHRETGMSLHATLNVRYLPYCVRYTPGSRRSSPDGEWLLLTRTGHSASMDSNTCTT
jgi:hypothetical protein